MPATELWCSECFGCSDGDGDSSTHPPVNEFNFRNSPDMMNVGEVRIAEDSDFALLKVSLKNLEL